MYKNKMSSESLQNVRGLHTRAPADGESQETVALTVLSVVFAVAMPASECRGRVKDKAVQKEQPQ